MSCNTLFLNSFQNREIKILKSRISNKTRINQNGSILNFSQNLNPTPFEKCLKLSTLNGPPLPTFPLRGPLSYLPLWAAFRSSPACPAASWPARAGRTATAARPHAFTARTRPAPRPPSPSSSSSRRPLPALVPRGRRARMHPLPSLSRFPSRPLLC